MRTVLTMAGALVVLAGCGSSPLRPLTPTPQGISYVYEGEQIETATEAATKHCAAQGQAARLSNVSRQQGQNVAVFTCD